jgi:predicted amidohydrolase YtcJ
LDAYKNVPGQWVRLHGYETLELAEMRSPTAEEIDSVVPDRPVHLITRTFHESAVNTMALAKLRFNPDEKDTAGVMMDKKGRPTGVLIEAASFKAELASRPQYDQSVINERLRWYSDMLFSSGITSICDAAVPISFAREYKERAEEVGIEMVPLLIDDRIDAPGFSCDMTAKVLADGGEYCHLCLTKRQVYSITMRTLRAAFGRNRKLAMAMGKRIGFLKKDR